MMTVTIPGCSSITGTPEVIVRLMKDARFFDALEGDEYIEKIREDIHRCFDIDLHVKGRTYAERAESLLRELAQNNMLTIEEEEK